METVLLSAALTSQVTEWLDSYGAIMFYLIVWGLVFAGTGLLIGAFIPRQDVLGWFNLQGLVLLGLYVFGIVSVFAVALVMKRFNKAKSDHALLLELPSYRLPNLRDLAIGLWDRVELSAARQEFDTGDTGALLGLGQGFTFTQDVIGVKVRLTGSPVCATWRTCARLSAWSSKASAWVYFITRGEACMRAR